MDAITTIAATTITAAKLLRQRMQEQSATFASSPAFWVGHQTR